MKLTKEARHELRTILAHLEQVQKYTDTTSVASAATALHDQKQKDDTHLERSINQLSRFLLTY